MKARLSPPPFFAALRLRNVGWGAELYILEVAGSIPAAALSGATLDKLFTHIVQCLWCYNLMALYKSV